MHNYADMMAMMRSIQTFMLSEPDSSKSYITMYITLYYVMYILCIYMHIYVPGSRPPQPMVMIPWYNPPSLLWCGV